MSFKKKSNKDYLCCDLCISFMIVIGIILAAWTVLSIIWGPWSAILLDNYLSLEEHQCTIIRIEVPEQLPSLNYTNNWKGCTCDISLIGDNITCDTCSIRGHKPCIKYHTDIDTSKMVINEIYYKSFIIKKIKKDCTYSSEICQCDMESLNATILRMAQLKANETNTVRTCYQGNGNIYFKKIMDGGLIIMFSLTWGWLIILAILSIIVYLWRRRKKEDVESSYDVNKHDIESLASTDSKPPSYELSEPLQQPPPMYENKRTEV